MYALFSDSLGFGVTALFYTAINLFFFGCMGVGWESQIPGFDMFRVFIPSKYIQLLSKPVFNFQFVCLGS